MFTSLDSQIPKSTSLVLNIPMLLGVVVFSFLFFFLGGGGGEFNYEMALEEALTNLVLVISYQS